MEFVTDKIAELELLIENSDLRYFGFRIFSPTRPTKVCQKLLKSWRWEDNCKTKKRLNGACAIQVINGDVARAYSEFLENSYPGEVIVLCGADNVENGQEPYERVLEDAIILAIL